MVLLGSAVIFASLGTAAVAQSDAQPATEETPAIIPDTGEPASQSESAAVQPDGAQVPLPMVVASTSDGDRYQVSGIDLRYGGFAADDDRLPDLAAAREVVFHLVETEDGFIGPTADRPGEPYTIDALMSGEVVGLYGSALREIGGAVAGEVIRSAGVIGIYAVPAFDQIGADGEDKRGDETSLTIEVRAGSVSEVRTIASGERIPFDDRINNPGHERIRAHSPAVPMLEGGPASFLSSGDLENYLHRLNRHPGRRVELAVAPGVGRDEAVIDFLVYENRPWRIHAQLSNTGTEQTNTWRERFGFTHTQLTGRDDILNIEFTTAGFEQTNAVIASYDTPLGGSDRLRGRVAASWSEFAASDVGDSLQEFTGRGLEASGDLVYTLFQKQDLFVDVFVGTRLFQSKIDNITADLQGEESFFVPRIGVAVERYRDTSTLDASLVFESSMAGVTSVDEAELANLGRLNADRSWQVLRGGVGYSFYLEPMFEDNYTHGKSTLAHEVSLSTRGQWSMGDRLIPVEQQVAGGLYSVRGYPESVAAGDSVIIGSAEYRFHVPRALSPGKPRKGIGGDQFRWRPTEAGENPDWDLLARGFVDVARTFNSSRQDFEFDETLVGAGLGLELVIRRNLSLRADWGVALKDMDSGEVTAGSNRFHFVLTFVY
ncbi:MAG: ShlB/FhaC/HecB family hemolysin secretion/activation protein [Planctomycetota bacterium]|nr:ShlB/FhaC/HecB family hemolysin secretion/activation protein [Planctomycetota bacterium]